MANLASFFPAICFSVMHNNLRQTLCAYLFVLQSFETPDSCAIAKLFPLLFLLINIVINLRVSFLGCKTEKFRTLATGDYNYGKNKWTRKRKKKFYAEISSKSSLNHWICSHWKF